MAGYYETYLQNLQHLAPLIMNQRRMQEVEQNNEYNRRLHQQQLMRQYEQMQMQERYRQMQEGRFQQNQQRLVQGMADTNQQRDLANRARLAGLEMQLQRMNQPHWGEPQELLDTDGNVRQVRLDSRSDRMVDATSGAPVPRGAAAQLRKPKTLTGKERGDLEKSAQSYSDLISLLQSFKPEYAGYVAPIVGEAVGTARQYLPGLSSDMPNWWREFHRISRMPERHGLAGAALTTREIAEFAKGDINPGMKPDDIIKLLNQRIALRHRGLSRAMHGLKTRYHPDEIRQAAGMEMPDDPLKDPRYPSLDELAARGAALSKVGPRPPLEELLK